jgi:hypothetical protein
MTTLNRGTRRRLQRNGVVVKELESIIEEQTRNAIDYTVRQYSAVVALCLKDKLGFGKTRAQRFLKDVDTMFSDVLAGYLTLDDVIETVEKELNITI